jgi:hypothetical protein
MRLGQLPRGSRKPKYRVEEARSRGILTVGIGDVGNGVGFGVIQDTVHTVMPAGTTCLACLKYLDR